MSLLNDMREAKKRFGTYIEGLQKLLREYKVEGDDWYANLKLANRNSEFRARRNAIWKEILEQQGGNLGLPVILGIVGAMLGGIGIAGFGGAIGLPLALLLVPVGIIVGNEADSEGITGWFGDKIRQLFGPSNAQQPQDGEADAATTEPAVLLELQAETSDRCDVLEQETSTVRISMSKVEGDVGALSGQVNLLKNRVESDAVAVGLRCNAVEQGSALLKADVANLSNQLTLMKNGVEMTHSEVEAVHQRTTYLGWGFLIVGVILVLEFIWNFHH